MGTSEEGTVTTVLVRCPLCGTLNRVNAERSADRPQCGECEKPLHLDRPVPVTDEDLERIVKESEIPVVVDFYADWCGPCKYMAPVLDAMARKRVGQVLITKLDTDRNPASAVRYGIRGIPTLIVFKDGQEAKRQVGAVPQADLEKVIDAVLTEQA